MALTLRVTSFHSQALGAQGVKTFGARGGSIGRRQDNDWVLPDPERFISGCHAQIACRNGTYYLHDVSVNGTFVNGSAQPVGNGVEQALTDGDRLQIGEYEIAVSVDATDRSASTGPSGFDSSPGAVHQTGPSAPGDAAGPAPSAFGSTGPTSSQGFAGQDLGQPSSVDPLDFFGDNSRPQQSTERPGVQADHASTMEQYYRPPPVEQAPPSQPDAGQSGIPENWDETGFSPSSSEPKPPPPDFGPPAAPVGAPPSPPQAPVPPAAGDAAEVLAALLQAAGLDATKARTAVAAPGLANNLGMLLSVVVQGMVEVLKARTEIKSQFRVPVTMMRPVENNPLKFSATPAQALQTLLDQQGQAYLGPVEAFSEGFRDIKAHQVAMMAGMRAAFDSMIQRFDPEELTERFDKRVKRGSLLSMPGKGRYWEMYRDLYDEWTQDADVNFQRLFGDEFARAYEEQMQRLTTARR